MMVSPLLAVPATAAMLLGEACTRAKAFASSPEEHSVNFAVPVHDEAFDRTLRLRQAVRFNPMHHCSPFICG